VLRTTGSHCSNVIAQSNNVSALVTAHNTRGLALTDAGRYDEAIDDFTFVIGHEPQIAGFYDKGALVRLRLQCAEVGISATLDDVRQAVLALAAPSPEFGQADPWAADIEAFLADATTRAAASGVWDEGPLARISMYGEPFWFVAMRDIRLRLGARGRDATVRIRVALSDLGWREQRCFAWGRRAHGFVHSRTAPNKMPSARLPA
jgi:hypothetical protein